MAKVVVLVLVVVMALAVVLVVVMALAVVLLVVMALAVDSASAVARVPPVAVKAAASKSPANSPPALSKIPTRPKGHQ